MPTAPRRNPKTSGEMDQPGTAAVTHLGVVPGDASVLSRSHRVLIPAFNPVSSSLTVALGKHKKSANLSKSETGFFPEFDNSVFICDSSSNKASSVSDGDILPETAALYDAGVALLDGITGIQRNSTPGDPVQHSTVHPANVLRLSRQFLRDVHDSVTALSNRYLSLSRSTTSDQLERIRVKSQLSRTVASQLVWGLAEAAYLEPAALKALADENIEEHYPSPDDIDVDEDRDVPTHPSDRHNEQNGLEDTASDESMDETHPLPATKRRKLATAAPSGAGSTPYRLRPPKRSSATRFSSGSTDPLLSHTLSTLLNFCLPLNPSDPRLRLIPTHELSTWRSVLVPLFRGDMESTANALSRTLAQPKRALPAAVLPVLRDLYEAINSFPVWSPTMTTEAHENRLSAWRGTFAIENMADPIELHRRLESATSGRSRDISAAEQWIEPIAAVAGIMSGHLEPISSYGDTWLDSLSALIIFHPPPCTVPSDLPSLTRTLLAAYNGPPLGSILPEMPLRRLALGQPGAAIAALVNVDPYIAGLLATVLQAAHIPLDPPPSAQFSNVTKRARSNPTSFRPTSTDAATLALLSTISLLISQPSTYRYAVLHIPHLPLPIATSFAELVLPRLVGRGKVSIDMVVEAARMSGAYDVAGDVWAAEYARCVGRGDLSSALRHAAAAADDGRVELLDTAVTVVLQWYAEAHAGHAATSGWPALAPIVGVLDSLPRVQIAAHPGMVFLASWCGYVKLAAAEPSRQADALAAVALCARMALNDTVSSSGVSPVPKEFLGCLISEISVSLAHVRTAGYESLTSAEATSVLSVVEEFSEFVKRGGDIWGCSISGKHEEWKKWVRAVREGVAGVDITATAGSRRH
ncbi:hypothetical protein HDU93_006803 [Gonapodya sp. JEL0774]|nr:hypothetical protein HDU93_006803 [Gonapodya sp. JEL0774]